MAATGDASSSDDLDSANYSPLTHLDAIFAHPSTLSRAPAALNALQTHQSNLASSIAAAQTHQASSDASSLARMKAAQTELQSLFAKIDHVRARALATEQTITSMTADIKRLDATKKNLALSMTALKRLQMLTTAYEQLRTLVPTRQYRECAQLLAAVLQLMAHFRTYRSVDQIAALGRKVADTQRALLEQVCEDFEVAFAQGQVGAKRAVLREACDVLDALGENARARLVTWYTNTTLREYRQVFRGNDEAGSLDNISRRYAWFSRMLKTYDVEHAAVFPAHWRVNETLANAFCEGTRDDFVEILGRAGADVNVDLVLGCLSQTLEFEGGLERRFAGDPRPSSDTTASDTAAAAAAAAARPYAHISKAFEPYVSLWIQSQDRHFALLITKYKTQPLRDPNDEDSPSVHPSSTDLFNQYRLALTQCAKLSTGERLLELSQTFAKYLDAYANQVLFHYLSGTPTTAPEAEDIVVVLNTADYCATTSSQLEEKIKSRIDAALAPQVDLEASADALLGVCGAAVRALVRLVEMSAEPALREMRNTSWRMESVGDVSAYVAELEASIQGRASAVASQVTKQTYQRAFWDHLVEAVTAQFLATVAQSKPISEAGAEQLLLDAHRVKAMLLGLPEAPPSTYAKRVGTATGRVDALLKTLQVRPSPPEALVQAYLIHVADTSEANFARVLELKGIARREQAPLVELFNAHKTAGPHASLPASAGWLAGLSSLAAGGSSGASAATTPQLAGSTSTAAAAGLGFGSALLSAAREGVDRIGSAAGSEAASRVASPPVGFGPPGGFAGQALNENLKGLGRFFRRDTAR